MPEYQPAYLKLLKTGEFHTRVSEVATHLANCDSCGWECHADLCRLHCLSIGFGLNFGLLSPSCQRIHEFASQQGIESEKQRLVDPKKVDILGRKMQKPHHESKSGDEPPILDSAGLQSAWIRGRTTLFHGKSDCIDDQKRLHSAPK